MEHKREDVNAMFTANTAVRGEVVEIEIGGRKVPIRVTVKLRKDRRDAAYSLVNNACIEARDDGAGCQQRTYTVRQGLWIEVLVKNLGDAAVELRSSWCDDHLTHAGEAVTMQPQQEYTLPEPLRMEAHEKKNKWNLFFAQMPLARLVLVFERNEAGEQTIRELLLTMEKVVDAY
jgi:hypothetical protein